MATIPPFSDLSQEGIPAELRGPMGGVFRNLNDFAKGTVAGLQGQLTFKDNMAAQVTTFSVTVPNDWQTPTLNAGWSNYGNTYEPASYRKDATGRVEVRGLVVSAVVGAVFTLPAGYIPALSRTTATIVNAGSDVFARLDIKGLTDAKPGAVAILNTAPSNFGSIACSFYCSDFSPYVPSCWPVVVKYSLSSPPVGVWLWNAVEITTGQKSFVAPNGIDWEYAAGTQSSASGSPVSQLKVRNIPGLLPNKKYSVTIVAVSG